MWSNLWPHNTGRFTWKGYSKAATASAKAQWPVDPSWKVVQWHKVKPFFTSKSAYQKDLKQKQIFLSLTVTKGKWVLYSWHLRNEFLNVWGIYLCFVLFSKLHLLSLWQCKYPSGAQTFLLSIFPGSKQKYSLYNRITQMHCFALLLTNPN